MSQICLETPEDEYEVEMLLDLCFAPGRTALSSYRLRDGVEPVAELCLLLRDHGAVNAAIRYWPVRISEHRALLLGPIAVHPTAQGEGLGALLMQHSLGLARELGWSRVLLVGDAPYYSRFGFTRLDHIEMPPPTNPERVLGLELQDGAWIGVEGPVTKDIDSTLVESAQTPHIQGENGGAGPGVTRIRDRQHDDDQSAAGASSDQGSRRS